MKPSPLDLHYYYVTELTFSVNKTFKAGESSALEGGNLRIFPELRKSEDPKSEPEWIMTLRVQQLAADDQPYSFSLELVGYLSVSSLVPEEKRELFLRANGASMLYGAAREIIRSVSAQGPYMPAILPSVSFYPAKDKPLQVENQKSLGE
ncbi:MAG: protein-export chaperone SecB [Verrucomicrobia bacterium]|nr:protein-export chaperone SecB [Verrucomicrobiota bacterium]